MMNDKDKKSLAVMILEKAGKKPKSSEKDYENSEEDVVDDSEDMSNDESKKEAMQNFIDAVSSKDVEGAMDALETFMNFCSEEEE